VLAQEQLTVRQRTLGVSRRELRILEPQSSDHVITRLQALPSNLRYDIGLICLNNFIFLLKISRMWRRLEEVFRPLGIRLDLHSCPSI
jgi:hypothetical protein